jgi:hypothetical protein
MIWDILLAIAIIFCVCALLVGALWALMALS